MNPLPYTAYVPCFNNAATIRQAVESLLAQTVRPAEVLVIDDGSTDGSAAALQALDVRVIRHARNLGRGAARARAMAEARHDLVLSCDATNVLEPAFAERAQTWFDDPKVAGVFGKITQDPPRTVAERWRGRHLLKLDAAPRTRTDVLLATYGVLMRGSSVRAAGGYDAGLRHNEDGDLGARLLACGFKVVYDPEIVVRCVASNSCRQVLERYWRWYAGKDEAVTWRGYARNVGYSIKGMAAADLRERDFPAAVISLVVPHYQYWKSRARRLSRRAADANGALASMPKSLADFPGRAFRRLKRASALQRPLSRLEDAAATGLFWLRAGRRRVLRAGLAQRQLPAECVAMAADTFDPHQIRVEIIGLLERAAVEKPCNVCEIGTADGGTNFLLAHALPTVEFVIGIDLFVKGKARLRHFARPGQRLNYLDGSSYAPETVERTRRILEGRQLDLLFIDGDHSYAGALQDFLLYRQFVREGGLIVFHDICPDFKTRHGRQTPRSAGDVPVLWRKIKRAYTHEEFVENPEQDGLGIGMIRYSSAVPLPADL